MHSRMKCVAAELLLQGTHGCVVASTHTCRGARWIVQGHFKRLHDSHLPTAASLRCFIRCLNNAELCHLRNRGKVSIRISEHQSKYLSAHSYICPTVHSSSTPHSSCTPRATIHVVPCSQVFSSIPRKFSIAFFVTAPV